MNAQALAIVPSVSTLILGTNAIRSAIATITSSGARLDKLIQETGLSVLNHIELHGDVTLLCELYLGMPKGSRKLALAEWALAYGKVVANTDAKTKGTRPFSYDKTKATNLQGAMSKPWFDFKPEQAVDTAFDFQAMLMALLNKADKAATKGLTIEGQDLLSSVRLLAAGSASKA